MQTHTLDSSRKNPSRWTVQGTGTRSAIPQTILTISKTDCFADSHLPTSAIAQNPSPMKTPIPPFVALLTGTCALFFVGCGADEQQPGAYQENDQTEVGQNDPAETTTPPATGMAQPYGTVGTASSGMGTSAPGSPDGMHDTRGMDHAAAVGYNARQLLQTAGLSEQEIRDLASSSFEEEAVKLRVQEALEASGTDAAEAEERAQEIARHVSETGSSERSEGLISPGAIAQEDTLVMSRELEERVRQELRNADDLALNAEEIEAIEVAVDENTVTLTGMVESEEEAQLIEDRIWGVEGVESIENHLQASR